MCAAVSTYTLPKQGASPHLVLLGSRGQGRPRGQGEIHSHRGGVLVLCIRYFLLLVSGSEPDSIND